MFATIKQIGGRAVALAGVFAASSLQAATVYVNVSAAPGGHGSAGAPFQDVQSGINAAVNGDTVLVLPGTYADFRASLNGKAITLKSQAGTTATIFDLTWVVLRSA